MPATAVSTTRFAHGITAIDTDYIRPQLDASHLLIEGGRAAFVDTGTHYSVPMLLETLQQQNIDVANVEYVFLTHVHLDHAGGASSLLSHLPNAMVVVHPRGARHMVDPGKLIAGTIAVYGEQGFADLYGKIAPISERRIIVAEDGQAFSLAGRTLKCFFTLGHAKHHYCLWDDKSAGVFTGDSFGVSYRELDSADGPYIFPTTTPIDFDPDEAHLSVDRIMSYEPEQIFLTHYSRVTGLPRLADALHRGLEVFVAIAIEFAKHAERTQRIREAMFEYFRAGLSELGHNAGEDRLHALLDFDVQLNTQGLEVWLDRRR